MANLVAEAPADGAPGLIDGQFAVRFAAPLAQAGGGLQAFGASSARLGDGFMAVQVAAGWPVRARALSVLHAAAIGNVLVPYGHGPVVMPAGETGYFVVCRAPVGSPLSVDSGPWTEDGLIDLVLVPVAAALVEMHARGVTHRSIRPNNVFHGSNAADAVTLGSAWAAPPACRQPCVYEPPYAAVCLPAGRGDGSPADDIYALGVLLVTLALGRDPMAGMDDDAIIRKKLDQGSFAAVVGTNRLPTAVGELVRGMLADDSEHRPSAVLLGDPAAARARRGMARPPRRAQRAFVLGDQPATTARELAHAMLAHPDQGASQLRNGAIGTWLRRVVGDGDMASRVDELRAMREDATSAEEPRADALLACRAGAVLDPLAPLTWKRLAVWPDGLGAALNQALHADPAVAAVLTEIDAFDVPAAFGAVRPERTDLTGQRSSSYLAKACLAVKQPELGTLRLNYGRNPLVPCASPLFAGQWVTKLTELLPALEAAATGPLRATLPPVDRHIVAFVGMRRDERGQIDLGQLANLVAADDPMTQLRLLARLQHYTHREPLPALTVWLAETVAGMTGRFYGLAQRTALTQQLGVLAKGGLLAPIVALLDDPPRQAADKADYLAAVARNEALAAEIEAVSKTMVERRAAAMKRAHNAVSGIGLAACGIALATAVFL